MSERRRLGSAWVEAEVDLDDIVRDLSDDDLRDEMAARNIVPQPAEKLTTALETLRFTLHDSHAHKGPLWACGTPACRALAMICGESDD